MESMWIFIALILSAALIILTVCHMYYRMNIRHITKQLEEIISIPDTNQLLTLAASQKDAAELSSVINDLLRYTRLSSLQARKMNLVFRKSITNISHDLRTPLTTASGYIQMMQDGCSESEAQDYLKIILERQNMVKLLLEQLFEYVRIESGEITYEHVPVDARKVFVDTLTMYYDDFTRKNQEPHIDLPDSPCIVPGDEQGIKRIFSNILFNALTHGSGDYSFDIKASDKYTFTFSNTSPPMTGEDIDNIFERSYTLDQSKNRKTTGLGLAIAREITNQLGGEIQAFYINGRFSISVSFPKA